VLPEYNPVGASHFGHVTSLLRNLAHDSDLAVIIERAAGPVEIPGAARVIAQRHRRGLGRLAELFLILWRLSARGYTTVFVRISTPATMVALAVRYLRGGRVLVWRSGQGKEFNPPLSLRPAALRHKLLVELPWRLTLKLVDTFVTGPESMVDYFVEHWRADRDRTRVLYNDVDLNWFKRVEDTAVLEAWRQRLGVPPGARVVLSVGRISPIRTIDRYLPLVWGRAAAEFDDVHFVYIGGGPDADQVKAAVRAAGLEARSSFPGRVPLAELPAVYSLAEVFLLPFFEAGFPRVILEAMAVGLPLASTDCGGVRDIVPPEQLPLVVDKRRPAALAAALIAVLSDHALAARLSAANLARVARYDVRVVAGMYLEVLFGADG
jgi:glycosyltransferase involved in cell wall biosynthesis